MVHSAIFSKKLRILTIVFVGFFGVVSEEERRGLVSGRHVIGAR